MRRSYKRDFRRRLLALLAQLQPTDAARLQRYVAAGVPPETVIRFARTIRKMDASVDAIRRILARSERYRWRNIATVSDFQGSEKIR